MFIFSHHLDVLYAPVLFGAMYIPPENSIYSSIDFCDVTEDDILKFVAEKKMLLIFFLIPKIYLFI